MLLARLQPKAFEPSALPLEVHDVLTKSEPFQVSSGGATPLGGNLDGAIPQLRDGNQRSRSGWATNIHVLLATGINADGYRKDPRGDVAGDLWLPR